MDKLASELRQIADKIDRSVRPSRALVAAELERLIARTAGASFTPLQTAQCMQILGLKSKKNSQWRAMSNGVMIPLEGGGMFTM